MRSFLPILVGVATGLLLAASPLRAIDPLPLELEHAPLATQAVYWNKMARESLEEKIVVGRQRYERRQAVKADLARQSIGLADARRSEFQRQTAFASSTGLGSPESTEGFSWGFGLLLLSGGALVGWYFYTQRKTES